MDRYCLQSSNSYMCTVKLSYREKIKNISIFEKNDSKYYPLPLDLTSFLTQEYPSN